MLVSFVRSFVRCFWFLKSVGGDNNQKVISHNFGEEPHENNSNFHRLSGRCRFYRLNKHLISFCVILLPYALYGRLIYSKTHGSSCVHDICGKVSQISLFMEFNVWGKVCYAIPTHISHPCRKSKNAKWTETFHTTSTTWKRRYKFSTKCVNFSVNSTFCPQTSARMSILFKISNVHVPYLNYTSVRNYLLVAF